MKVKINTHGNALPEVHGEWIDLCTAEDVTLDFLEYKIISLGVSIEIPAGYYAHVVPRSSTFGKWGILLANSMGVIENDYCGDGDVWGYPALCLRKEGTRIPKGTRICQFRLVEKAPDMEFVQVESLGNRDRGGLAVPASRYIPAARRNGTSRSGTAAWSECSASGRAGPRRRRTVRRGHTRAFCWWCVRSAERSRHSARSGKLTVSGVRSADTKRRWMGCGPCSCTVSAVSRSATRPMRRRRPSPIAAWTARHPWIWS